MTNESSLETFGTISFGSEFMNQTIGWGEPIFEHGEFKGFNKDVSPGRLEISVWMSFLPENMRGISYAIIEQIKHLFFLQKATDIAKSHFIDFFHQKLLEMKQSGKFDLALEGQEKEQRFEEQK